MKIKKIPLQFWIFGKGTYLTKISVMSIENGVVYVYLRSASFASEFAIDDFTVPRPPFCPPSWGVKHHVVCFAPFVYIQTALSVLVVFVSIYGGTYTFLHTEINVSVRRSSRVY